MLGKNSGCWKQVLALSRITAWHSVRNPSGLFWKWNTTLSFRIFGWVTSYMLPKNVQYPKCLLGVTYRPQCLQIFQCLQLIYSMQFTAYQAKVKFHKFRISLILFACYFIMQFANKATTATTTIHTECMCQYGEYHQMLPLTQCRL